MAVNRPTYPHGPLYPRLSYVAFFTDDMFLSRVGVFDTWMPRWLVEGARKLSIIVEILQVAGINYSVHVVVDINENVPVSPRRTRT